ncbi:MAG: FAD-dependent oxidoreductase [Saprospiraceae bacterium]
MKKILVIGQGIAGTMLAWTLESAGLDVWIASDPDTPGASAIAAGIINPVTGKRYAKSWEFEAHWACAQQVYARFEAQFQTKVLHPRTIHRLLTTPEEVNNWTTRSGMPQFEPFMDMQKGTGFWHPFIAGNYYTGLIRQAAQVDFKTLVEAYSKHKQTQGKCILRNLPYSEWEKQLADFDALISSEGARAEGNPFFDTPVWQNAKGEALFIRFSDPAFHKAFQNATEIPMLKKDLMLASPGGNWSDIFWAGASYEWEFESHHSTSESARMQLIESLQSLMNIPVEVIGQAAGVRPVVKDRRPLLGQSKKRPGVFIFNGFGSKGGLLTPYWAEVFRDFLISGKSLPKEVDCHRFELG